MTMLSKLTKKICAAIVCLAVFSLIIFKPKTITRAAVDVGSGSIKVTVAKVDVQNNKIHKILYAKEHPIPFKRDIQVEGRSKFSEKIEELLPTVRRFSTI